MSTMRITDVGPVNRLDIPIEPGTITLLRGPNNSGKSRTLNAASRALGGDEKIAARHNAGKSGRIEYGDLTMTVGASTRKKGQTECLGLAGRFDVSELIDPPQKTAELADAHRTKVLCRLTGVEADIDIYGHRAGTFPDDVLEETDAVELAKYVKRLMEEARRDAENQANQARGEAKAAKEAVGDTDLTAEADFGQLRHNLQEATAAKIRLEEQAIAARETNERVREAKAAIEKAESNYSGPAYDEADILYDEADRQRVEATAAVDRAKGLLDAAAAEERLTIEKRKVAQSLLEISHTHFESMAAWKEQTERGAVPVPVTSEVSRVGLALLDAAQAVEQGAIIRKAREHNAAYIKAREETEKHETASKHWAAAAAEVWPTLAKTLDVDGMTLRDGRWYIKVNGVEQPFHDQSDGFRTVVALDILTASARKAEPDRPIVAVLQQPNWEALDQDNRERVATMVRDKAISLVTAEADHVWPDGERTELRAETLAEK